MSDNVHWGLSVPDTDVIWAFNASVSAALWNSSRRSKELFFLWSVRVALFVDDELWAVASSSHDEALVAPVLGSIEEDMVVGVMWMGKCGCWFRYSSSQVEDACKYGWGTRGEVEIAQNGGLLYVGPAAPEMAMAMHGPIIVPAGRSLAESLDHYCLA